MRNNVRDRCGTRRGTEPENFHQPILDVAQGTHRLGSDWSGDGPESGVDFAHGRKPTPNRSQEPQRRILRLLQVFSLRGRVPSNPESRMEMTSFYAAHVRDTHLADESTHDDPNQSGVQVLDGATRRADN